jgi:hypothetical protein
MPNGWKITIHGGFALVFEGDQDNSGVATRVTIGPYRKPSGHPRYHPHRMILAVPESSLNRVRTTMPYQPAGGSYLFELRDDIALNDAAKGDITRRISATQPASADDFYWVYDADRFNDRTGTKRTPLGDWPNKLLTRLALQGGRLQVLPSAFIYDITGPSGTFQQPLATHIEYHPTWPTPAEVEFRTGHGMVVAQPANFDIWADCGCADDPTPGTTIAGFDLTYDLYQDPKAAPRFEPNYKGYRPPAKANAPGPDCPPRSYSI